MKKVMESDMEKNGIRVNEVEKGIMMREMEVEKIKSKGGKEWFMKSVMMKRIGEKREVVDKVVFIE